MKLKSADPSLLLVPLNNGVLAPGYQDKSTFPYVDRPVEVPVNSATEFKNYLSYTIEREQINGVFVLRTTKLLWTIKEDAGVRNFMTANHIRLSQTSYMPEKRRECFFSTERMIN